jgi:hypothetical protein
MKIKQWAFLTAGMYALTLVVLTIPLLLITMSGSPIRDPKLDKNNAKFEHPSELLGVYSNTEYWIAIGVLSLMQGAVLLAPISVLRQKPVRRRSWLVLAVVAGLMMGLLVLAIGLSIYSALFLDKGDATPVLWIGFAGWIVWAAVFYGYSSRDPSSAFSKVMDRLIAGSIAELLVAVPCHVYVRQQDNCCADLVTFLGIATGLSVLLFAFGPGVFLLFVKRARRLQAAKEVPDETGSAVSGKPTLSGFTRRAVFWAAGALMLALVPVALLLAPEFNTREVWIVFRAGFVHAAAIACIYAWIALRKKEARGTWVLAGVAILAEMALLQAWLLARHPI